MNITLFLATLILLSMDILVVAQPNRIDVENVDSWPASTPLVILSNESEDHYIFQCLQSDSGILGGERDISLELDSGEAGRVLSVSVNGGEFSLAAPTSTTGNVVVQYDGDDCSSELSLNGLNNADLTSKRGDSFHIIASADHEVDIEIRVHSSDGSMSSVIVTLKELENIIAQEFYIPFTSFGNVDFKAVGAIELFIRINENIDLTISTFAIAGKTRVMLVAPATEQCDFEKGCCKEVQPEFPIVLSSTSPSTSSSSEDTTNNDRASFDFYDDYYTRDTISSANTLEIALLLSILLGLLL